MSEFLQTPEALNDLQNRLGNLPLVSRHGPDEAGTLVHAFSDIEESMLKFLHHQLPRLADPSVEGPALEDLLLEIREEFRHILYHLHDPGFFRVLEPTHEWLAVRADAEHF